MLMLITTSFSLPLATFASSVLFAAGVGLLTMILMRRSYKQLGKRRRGSSNKAIEAQPRPANAWSGMHKDADAVLSRQEVEFHEMIREMNGQLDSKMILLQELIAKSQRQIDQLETLIEKIELKDK